MTSQDLSSSKIIVFLISIHFFLTENFFEEVSNITTLVVEIGVGLIIAIFVHRTSKKTEKKNDEYLEKTSELIFEEKQIRDNKRIQFLNDLHMFLHELRANLKNAIITGRVLEEQQSEYFSEKIETILDTHNDVLTLEDRKILKRWTKYHFIYLSSEKIEKDRVLSEIKNSYEYVKEIQAHYFLKKHNNKSDHV